MEEKLKKCFYEIKYKPEKDLARNVWVEIVAHEKRILHLKIWIFSTTGVLSLAGLIPAIKALVTSFSTSGFYEYLSVVFSSNSSIASFWQELSYSIAESLPITNILFTFALIFILFLSMRYAVKQFIRVNYNFA